MYLRIIITITVAITWQIRKNLNFLPVLELSRRLNLFQAQNSNYGIHPANKPTNEPIHRLTERVTRCAPVQ